MIGNMISKIRKEKGITKTQLANETDINIGHLTHIEKGERNPSHKALKSICSALNIPYQQLLYTYDKTLTEEQKEYGYINHISYNQIPAISKIDEYEWPSRPTRLSPPGLHPGCSIPSCSSQVPPRHWGSLQLPPPPRGLPGPEDQFRSPAGD